MKTFSEVISADRGRNNELSESMRSAIIYSGWMDGMGWMDDIIYPDPSPKLRTWIEVQRGKTASVLKLESLN